MDPETSDFIMARHHPYRLLAVVGILRCARRCGPWPCGHWQLASDRRRRFDDLAAIERMTEILRTPPGQP